MRIYILTCIIFLLTFGIYLSCLCPTVTSDDSGELSGASATLGIAHSPGYPLYSITGKIFVSLIPYSNFAYRINVLSAFFVSITAVVIFFIISVLTGNNFVSFVSSLIFAFSPNVWQMGVVTEVYGTAMFFASIITFIILNQVPLTRPSVASPFLRLRSGQARGEDKCEGKYFYLLCLLFPLGVISHYNLLFLIFSMGYYLYLQKNQIYTKNWLYVTGFFVLGLLILLYLPIRSLNQPLYDWEDPQTLKRFWQVIARLRYGSLNLAQGGAPPLNWQIFLDKLIFFVNSIISNVTLAGFLIGIAGMLYGFSKKQFKQKMIILIISLLWTGPGFILLANVKLDSGTMELLRRFLYLPLVFWVIILGLGIFWIYSKNKYISYLSLIIPFVLLIRNYDALYYRHQFVFYDYAKNILRSLPENSLLFSDRADEMEFVLSYLLYAEKRRQDIEFIDCNAAVSKSIYGDNYYRIWGPPRLRIREQVEKGIINRVEKPVYYATFLPEQVNIPKINLGLVYIAKPIDRLTNLYPWDFIPWDEIYSLRKPVESDIRAVNLYNSYFQLMSEYFYEHNSIEKAEKMLEYANIYYGKKDWRLRVAYWYFQKGYLDKAEKMYNEALEINPSWLEALSNLGVVYERQGRNSEAINCYRKAIEIKPDYTEAYFNLGVVYWKLKKWDKVTECFEKVLTYNPEHQEAKKFLAIVKGKRKNGTEETSEKRGH